MKKISKSKPKLCSRGHRYTVRPCPICWPGSRKKTVARYIKTAPKEARGKLAELRRIIRATVPKATERISYGMPYYGYKGRLAYFAFAKAHVGLYIPPPVIAEHKRELKRYGTARATVRFPLNKPLPVALIKKLIKARLHKNEEKEK